MSGSKSPYKVDVIDSSIAYVFMGRWIGLPGHLRWSFNYGHHLKTFILVSRAALSTHATVTFKSSMRNNSADLLYFSRFLRDDLNIRSTDVCFSVSLSAFIVLVICTALFADYIWTNAANSSRHSVNSCSSPSEEPPSGTGPSASVQGTAQSSRGFRSSVSEASPGVQASTYSSIFASSFCNVLFFCIHM